MTECAIDFKNHGAKINLLNREVIKMVIKEIELNLNEIEFIIEQMQHEIVDREFADYDDEVHMSNADIVKIIQKLRGLKRGII